MLAAGCEQPRTELVARVDSEVAWGAGATVQSVTLTVRRGGPAGPLRSDRTTALGTGGDRRSLPLVVGILPGDDTDTPVWIEALGCGDPNGCTPTTAVVAQRAVVRFTRGQTEEVPLLLASACVGGTCGSDERCGEGGRCEPATRATVRPFDGVDAGMVADVVSDAGGMDLGTVADAPMTDSGSPLDRNDLGAPVDVPAPDVLGTDSAPLPDATVSCPTTFANCDGVSANGCEVDTQSNSAHCSACGRVCPSGQSCDAGVCVALSCPMGMRLIPAGMFQMGAAGATHGVQLSAFCMDVTEVTVGAYATCAACSAPGRTMHCNWGVADRENHPANCVDWDQARAFCQSREGELPTEAQWEYAARGTDGRTYPWGNDAPTGQLCWNRDSPTSSTCPVRSSPSGDSAFGISDMAGNVWEWTADYFGSYTGSADSYVLNPTGPDSGTIRVLRGGSWSFASISFVQTSHRNRDVLPMYRDGSVGFRCVHRPL
ncbi:MAG: SUMF1/EgtB/PvdO family nonheme iron enzyme [Deltaproteobacteria bacterium]|nr:SUMF1/EgtB/PvdO family nonheme iron enzyme [Deltaproteobacteria bacterium]